jgi:hypothetical protein
VNYIKWIFSFIKGCGAFLLSILGILASSHDDESEDCPIGNGSDRFGEHNFRTGNMDSGADPYGWYEEDL